MARIINNGLRASHARRLSPEQLRAAERKLARATRANPLRVVRLGCHGPVRDASAQAGDRIWCEPCADFAEVLSVSE